MRVAPISKEECVQLLKRTFVGRLACCLNDEPYVVPVCFAYDSNSVYVFSTVGKKIEWMRQNPKVCFQADEYGSRSSWTSVVINGNYLELREPLYAAEKERAKERLSQNTQWWAMPMAERREQAEDLSIEPVFFLIKITSISGLRAIPEAE
jgi:uncharacterized protein